MSADEPGALCFVDLNVWLYAFIPSQDEAKAAVAGDLLRSREIVVSTQVVNEVCVNLIRKAKMAEAEVQTLVSSFYRKYPVVSQDQQALLTASELRADHSLAFWDSLMAASAFHAGAEILFSEDMQHGFVVRGKVTIIDPFSPVCAPV